VAGDFEFPAPALLGRRAPARSPNVVLSRSAVLLEPLDGSSHGACEARLEATPWLAGMKACLRTIVRTIGGGL
jgi:hypothetical protein